MKQAHGHSWILVLAAALPAYAGSPAAEIPLVGQEVPRASLPMAPAVHRNQPILLVAMGNGIRLSAPGRALKDGQAGDTIPVLNTATRTALKGVVRDGWIEIKSPGDPTP
ncbi:MAG: flagella basal body P-ring formation protein FlgA [Elusimicrobia bacterium]|nr:flagella basal body P-ring formation protein FlgA [Elusimicrobiota bacterium]